MMDPIMNMPPRQLPPGNGAPVGRSLDGIIPKNHRQPARRMSMAGPPIDVISEKFRNIHLENDLDTVRDSFEEDALPDVNSEPTYEGWTLYKANQPGEIPWTKVTRSRMRIPQDELAKLARKKMKKTLAEQYSAMSRPRRQQIDKLIDDKKCQDGDPRFDWTCVYLAPVYKEIPRKSFFTAEFEVTSMNIVLERHLRPGVSLSPRVIQTRRRPSEVVDPSNSDLNDRYKRRHSLALDARALAHSAPEVLTPDSDMSPGGPQQGHPQMPAQTPRINQGGAFPPGPPPLPQGGLPPQHVGGPPPGAMPPQRTGPPSSPPFPCPPQQPPPQHVPQRPPSQHPSQHPPQGPAPYHPQHPALHPPQHLPEGPPQHPPQPPPQHPQHPQHPPQHPPQNPPQHPLQHPPQRPPQGPPQHSPRHPPQHQPQRPPQVPPQHPPHHPPGPPHLPQQTPHGAPHHLPQSLPPHHPSQQAQRIPPPNHGPSSHELRGQAPPPGPPPIKLKIPGGKKQATKKSPMVINNGKMASPTGPIYEYSDHESSDDDSMRFDNDEDSSATEDLFSPDMPDLKRGRVSRSRSLARRQHSRSFTRSDGRRAYPRAMVPRKQREDTAYPRDVGYPKDAKYPREVFDVIPARTMHRPRLMRSNSLRPQLKPYYDDRSSDGHSPRFLSPINSSRGSSRYPVMEAPTVDDVFAREREMERARRIAEYVREKRRREKAAELRELAEIDMLYRQKRRAERPRRGRLGDPREKPDRYWEHGHLDGDPILEHEHRPRLDSRYSAYH